MGGVTSRIERAIKALEEGKVKKALFLTDNEKTKKQHDIVLGAAKKCLEDKESCPVNLQAATSSLKETITAPLDEVGLEGVEEYFEEKGEEQECDACEVADAVIKFGNICRECPDDGACDKIEENLKDDNTSPEKWIKTMVEISEKAECEKSAYEVVLKNLVEKLEKTNSSLLKSIDEA